MQRRYQYIDRLHDDVQRELRRPSLDADVKEWARRHLRAIRAERDLVLRRDDGYQDFLLSYLAREADKPRPGADVSASPYDEPRHEPLCTCAYSGCHLKHGQLGPQIRNAASIATGIREFQRQHAGLPVVLVGIPGSDEVTGARDAWSELCGLVEYRVGVLHAQLKRDLDAPPDPDPLAEPETTPVDLPATAHRTIAD